MFEPKSNQACSFYGFTCNNLSRFFDSSLHRREKSIQVFVVTKNGSFAISCITFCAVDVKQHIFNPSAIDIFTSACLAFDLIENQTCFYSVVSKRPIDVVDFFSV